MTKNTFLKIFMLAACVPLAPLRAEEAKTSPVTLVEFGRIKEKPYALSLDVLRLLCLRIRADAQLTKAAGELVLGLNAANCTELLRDQPPAVLADPVLLRGMILADLATNMSAADYNLSLLELTRIFEMASSTLFPPRPELVWGAVDELLTALHERNWQQTTEMRLDRESRIGTVAGHAFYWAKTTAMGVFVFRLGRGFLQGIHGTRYLSASLRGFTQRAGENIKYFTHRKMGWEKPVFARQQFEHNGVRYDYFIKTAGGPPSVRISRLDVEKGLTMTVETKTIAEVREEITKLNARVTEAALEKEKLVQAMNRTGSGDYAEMQRTARLLDARLTELRGTVEGLERALTYGRGIVPEHLKELVFRREVLGATEKELTTFAAEKGIKLSQLDYEFLAAIKPRSYFDRVLANDEVAGSRGAKFRKYAFGREALSIYLGAGLGAYLGSRYHAKLYARDITEFRESALQQLGESYETSLEGMESSLAGDLEDAQELIEVLQVSLQTKDLRLLDEFIKSQELKGRREALEFWTKDATAVVAGADRLKSSIAWLSKSYKAPEAKEATKGTEPSLAGIFFNPERVLGLHEKLLRSSHIIQALCAQAKLITQ